MMNLSTGKKNSILFDVDSTAITAGVFEYSFDTKTKKPVYRELASIRKDITGGKEYSFNEFYARTLKTFTDVATEIHTQALVPIENIYVNLSSPWMSAQKRRTEYQSKKDFTITQKFIDDLIQKEIDAPFSQNIDYYHHDVSLFDRQTLDIYANGYPTRNPVGVTARDLVIHSLTSVASRQTKADFEHVIERAFHRLPIFTSNVFVRFDTLLKSYPNQNDAVILDVSGELTECLVVHNDHIKHIGTFPVGIHNIVRKFAASGKISVTKARNYLNIIQEEKFLESHVKTGEKILRDSFNIWLEACFEFFENMSREGLLPNTLILSAPHDVRLWIAEHILQSDELMEHIHMKSMPELIHVADINSEEGMYTELDVFAAYLLRNEIQL